MENPSARQDVEVFIRSAINTLSEEVSMTSKTRRELEEKMIKISAGTFLHASLAWATFAGSTKHWTPQRVQREVNALSTSCLGLESFYCGLLRRIPKQFREQARSAFVWVLTSDAQLTLEQLHYAITITSKHKCLSDCKDDLDPNFERRFQQYCGHLLKVGSDGFVQFAHQSVIDTLCGTTSLPENEDILRYYREQLPEAHLYISQTCLFLMQWTDFSPLELQRSLFSKDDLRTLIDQAMMLGGPGIIKFIRSRLVHFPLLEYSLRYWQWHCTQESNAHILSENLLSFMRSSAADIFRLTASLLEWAEGAIHWAVRSITRETDDIHFYLPTLHYLLQSGDFAEVVERLVLSGEDINEVNPSGQTPLYSAIEGDREESFKVILKFPQLDPNHGSPGQNKPIHRCVLYNRIKLLKQLLNDPRTDVNSRGSNGQVALHLAFRSWRMDEVPASLLAHKSIDILACDEDGITPLETAFSHPHVEWAAAEMVRRVDITNLFKKPAGRPYTPISLASLFMQAGNWEWSKLELEILEADFWQVLVIEDDGMGALTRYAYHGRKSKVEFLLNRLPQEVITMDTNWGRYNILDLCANQGWEDMVDILLTKFHLDGLQSDHLGRTMLHWAIEPGWKYALMDHRCKPMSWLNKQDRDGLTALHIAISYRNEKAMRHLIDQGADYLLKEKHGRNVAHLAAEDGYKAALEIFLALPTREFGRDNHRRGLLHFLAMWQPARLLNDFIQKKKLLINIVDRTRRTPLHYAATYCNFSAATALINRGAAIDTRDSNGMTPLHAALREGHFEMVRDLIDLGADTSSLAGFRQTCLQLAIRGCNRQAILLLLNRSPDIHNRDAFGRTALHRMCEIDDAELVQELVTLGADVNSEDDALYTPLHIAVIRGNSSSIGVLLECQGIKLSQQDLQGCTPLDRALAYKQSKIVELLTAHGAKNAGRYEWKLRHYIPLRDHKTWNNWPVVISDRMSRGVIEDASTTLHQPRRS